MVSLSLLVIRVAPEGCIWHKDGEDRLTHYEKGTPAFEGARKLAIPSRGAFAERSSPSRADSLAPLSAPLTAAGRSAHFSAKKE
jgi:hypothetical protein